MNNADLTQHIDRLHAPGLIDMHYDLGMDLFDKRRQGNVLERDYLADMRAGGIGTCAAAIYLEDKYLPEMALRVSLDQISRLHAATDEPGASGSFAICKNLKHIKESRLAGKIGLVITLEGVEPLGSDPDLLRVFFELGVRAIGLTHVRRNMAGEGGVFADTGSSPQGLTPFGRKLISDCERMGIMVDLAHINPVGFDDILKITDKPPIVSHSNARKYFDIERNLSDDQIRAVGRRGGVIGVNAVLVSPVRATATIDRYLDHVDYMVEMAGIDSVAIGFDFFENIYKGLPAEDRAALSSINFVPGLSNHAHARNVTADLIARGWSDVDLEKFLYGNWLRVFKDTIS